MPTENGPVTLGIDIGGTGLKVELVDAEGNPVGERERVDTPHPSPPDKVLAAITGMAGKLSGYDRISAGFPGVVRNGVILTAPNLGTAEWSGFDLGGALTQRLGKPARVLNDAEVQGFGVITGRGIEFVLTLGTGAGTAIFRDGELMPHLELSQHPVRHDMTYDEYIGDAALKKEGVDHWNERISRVIELLFVLTHYDTLHLGGGNAAHIKSPPPKVVIGSNNAGLTGGVKLWGSGWPGTVD